MKTVYKILWFNLALALFLAVIFSLSDGPDTFIPVFGVICIFGGAIDIVIGLLLLAFRREWAQGFLLSAGVLLLLGFAVCSFAGAII